ncbi:tryptophan synthase subunit beta [candidate division KSB1 bacterium]|nr:tryptophan synthase subunit beta [candidate division KSB1 bacterium]
MPLAQSKLTDYPWPDERGYFGAYGGRYIPETLLAPCAELAAAYARIRVDPDFQGELADHLRQFAGRPTPLYLAERLADRHGYPVYLKREDLLHTGAHKINNALGQILLAIRLGKTRIIAETGAGQHGVATATVCARFGLQCVVYMGVKDMERQAPNVGRMRLLGAEVRPVDSGTQTLKDATSEAIRDWVTNVRDTFYLIGSVVGPHPYPLMVRDFQRVIGLETRADLLRLKLRPSQLVACVGGGSNAIGFFHEFLADEVELIGIEAGGEGDDSPRHAAAITRGQPGVLHGSRSYILQDDDGQIVEAHSISAGLDYPGVGPEHSFMHDAGRVRYERVSDAEALAAASRLAKLEGIVPALESAHALAWLERLPRDRVNGAVIVCLSGRGDKDLQTYLKHV